MAEPATKHPAIEGILEDVGKIAYGRSRVKSIKTNICVVCGKPASRFRDELSRKEFTISGLCQGCQDKVFTEPAEDVDDIE